MQYKFGIFGRIKMEFLYLFAMIVCLPYLGVSGRPMNISSSWFLPQEGFPVFYRYFGDKVTWTEADAICNCQHTNLLSVQTDSQMDAARAYLKEIDVSDNIWIGLKKESPEKPFSWSNDEKLLGDGYWSGPIPKTNEKLCAAIDPAADFRWTLYHCEGPQMASFVCQLEVPEWARKENGCLITSLPSLTVTLIPEAGVIQLMSDCGLDGTRTIACNSQMNREEIIKRLSCVGRTTTDTVRDVNTQQSSTMNINNRTNRQESFLPQTRHRRNANVSSPDIQNIPPQQGTTPPSKRSSDAFLKLFSHASPHSPHPASVRNAPSTKKPLTVAAPRRRISISTTGTPPPPKDLPVLIITGEKLNEMPSATSENPQVVFMIENKDLGEPFLVPLSDGVAANDASPSPLELIDVDLIEVDNFTSNGTANQTIPPVQGGAAPVRLSLAMANFTLEDPGGEPSNAVEEGKGVEVPPRPNRSRLLTHQNRPAFYTRFLNRVLG